MRAIKSKHPTYSVYVGLLESGSGVHMVRIIMCIDSRSNDLPIFKYICTISYICPFCDRTLVIIVYLSCALNL